MYFCFEIYLIFIHVAISNGTFLTTQEYVQQKIALISETNFFTSLFLQNISSYSFFRRAC